MLFSLFDCKETEILIQFSVAHNWIVESIIAPTECTNFATQIKPELCESCLCLCISIDLFNPHCHYRYEDRPNDGINTIEMTTCWIRASSFFAEFIYESTAWNHNNCLWSLTALVDNQWWWFLFILVMWYYSVSGDIGWQSNATKTLAIMIEFESTTHNFLWKMVKAVKKV